jgi:hypothetical protein
VIALQSNRYAPRVAGFSFLFLIVAVLGSSLLWRGVRTANGTADTLASIAEHGWQVRLGLVLTTVAGITTLVLAAMLYAVVAHQDRNLAILALSCRAVEGGLYAVGVLVALALLSLSHGDRGDASAVQAMAGQLMDARWTSSNVGAAFFAVGSTLYSYLLFKARAIPVPLSLTGLVGSLIVLVGVPWQTALSNPTFSGPSAAIWIPLAVFELSTGVWLLAKGARMPAGTTGSEPAVQAAAVPVPAAGPGTESG